MMGIITSYSIWPVYELFVKALYEKTGRNGHWRSLYKESIPYTVLTNLAIFGNV